MSDMDSMYQELILDHARHPHGQGLVEGFDGESFQVNPTCGDQIRLRVQLSDDKKTVDSVSWDGHGCSISQASISIMNDLVQGKSVDETNALFGYFDELMHNRGEGLKNEADEEALEDAIVFQGAAQFPMRIKCALIGWMALKDATSKALVGDASPAVDPSSVDPKEA